MSKKRFTSSKNTDTRSSNSHVVRYDKDDHNTVVAQIPGYIDNAEGLAAFIAACLNENRKFKVFLGSKALS